MADENSIDDDGIELDIVDKLIKALRDNRKKIRALAEAGGEFTVHLLRDEASIHLPTIIIIE